MLECMRLPRRDMGAQKMTGDKEASNKGVRGTSIKRHLMT